MARKLIFGIFISILSFFAMSHNANAINVNFENYTLFNQYVNFGNECRLQSGQNAPTGYNFCTFDSESSVMSLKEIQSKNAYNFKQGDILEYYFVIATRSNYTVPGGTYYLSEAINDNGLITLNTEIIDDYSALDFITFDNLMSNENAYVLYDFFGNYKVAKVYKITQYVPSDGAYKIGFNLTSTSAYRYIMQFYQTTGVDDILMFSLRNAIVYRQSESKENKEVEEKTQSAVDDSAQSGESSQGSVEGSTQNLMSAGASIISALSNAPATDCNINMSTSGSSSSFTSAIGSVNLCSGVPSGVLTMVQGIVALVFTPIVLYYTYSIITTIYKQFREYNS